MSSVAIKALTFVIALAVGAVGALAVEHCIIADDVQESSNASLTVSEYAQGSFTVYHITSNADAVIKASDGSVFVVEDSTYTEYPIACSVTYRMTFFGGAVPIIKG